MLTDLCFVIKWWLYILLIGILFLPLSQKYFSRFFDRGYAFAKVIGILILSYTAWFLSSIRVFPFRRGYLLAVILFVAMILFYAYKKRYIERLAAKTIVIILAEELLFFCCLLAWSYVRGLQPDIYEVEKFMDFGFVNAILQADYMPPIDMWFAGETINYYYFGQFICAYLTRLTSIDPAVTYNLMMATLFALTFNLTFSCAGNLYFVLKNANLKKALLAGIISALLLSFGGNLHGFIYGHALPFLQEHQIVKAEGEKYYYTQSTRYIGYNPPNDDKTIHEFPIYSFVISDLHGHVSDIPVVLTFLALLISICSYKNKIFIRRLSSVHILLALLLAVMYMTNTWDYPIYLTVYLSFLLYGYYFSPLSSQDGAAGPKADSVRLILDFLGVIALSQLLIFPFSLSFENISQGVGLTHYRTILHQFFVLWGHQIFLVLCFTIFLFKRTKKEPYTPALPETSPLKRSMLRRLYGALCALTVGDALCLILCICAVGLTIMPEIVYVRDIYYQGYHRANTMFKLTFEAFILFGITAGYIVVRIASGAQKKAARFMLACAFAVILLLPLSYAPFAIKGYYKSLHPSNYKGLDGLRFMEQMHPDDYAAVRWLKSHVTRQTVVLEANGNSYTYNGRISMATGFPTVQGWFVHEWLWRSSSTKPQKRAEDVALIYESPEEKSTMELMQKYDIQYIVIGNVEREKFKNLNEEKLLSLGEVVFEKGGTKIIKAH